MKKYNKKRENKEINADKSKETKKEIKKSFSYGLDLLDESIQKGNFSEGRMIFEYMKEQLYNKGEGRMKQEDIEKYQVALAERGYNFIRKLGKKERPKPNNEEILNYCKELLNNKPSKLERAITILSLSSIILSIIISYPTLTGNVISENINKNIWVGLILFILGIIGVFIANKSKS